MPYIKNSKWIKNLYVRPEIVKLEKNISRALFDIKQQYFLALSPKAKRNKSKNEQIGSN